MSSTPVTRPVTREWEAGHFLCDRDLLALIEANTIRSSTPITPVQIQPASLDLRLGDDLYELPASFLPGHATRVFDRLTHCRRRPLWASQTLRPGHIYLARLDEALALPYALSAVTNPKSSIGRLDVLVRVIGDYSTTFDQLPAGYDGPLYLEIIPQSFPIIVRAGDSLAQLRLQTGPAHLTDPELVDLCEETPLLYSLETHQPEFAHIERGLWLTLNLHPDPTSTIIGYQAKPGAPPLDLHHRHLPIEAYWIPLSASGNQLILQPNQFYILRSAEAVRIPTQVAAEMVTYDPAFGELRAHYAGFFDPGFGDDFAHPGTPAVLEVRTHQVPYLVEHGQPIARLLYGHLTTEPAQTYGPSIGSSYQRQSLTLSKHFHTPAVVTIPDPSLPEETHST